MTNEEKAEKYATEDLPDGYTRINYEKKKAYLDGLTEGEPKWHNLKENPNDLPEIEGYLENGKPFYTKMVIQENGLAVYYNFITQKWMFNNTDIKVVAWCEPPKLEV